MIIGKKHIKKLNLRKTDVYFLLAGFLAVITDFALYIFIKNFINISLAKGIGFFCGIAVSWIINSKLTFKHSKKNIIEFLMCLFVLINSLILNILINNFFLYMFKNKIKVIFSFCSQHLFQQFLILFFLNPGFLKNEN